MRKLSWLWLAPLAVLPISSNAENAEAYVQVGTEGVGVGVGYHFTERQALRIEANAGSISRDFDVSDNDYRGSVRPENFALLYDVHPWTTSGFRISLGAAVLNTEVHGRVTGDAVTIDGVEYPLAQGDTLKATAEPDRSVAAYVGLGWGRSLGRSQRWGFFADLGAYLTRFDADIHASQSLVDKVNAALAASGSSETAEQALAAEERELQDDVDDVNFYPVLKLGFTYRF